MPATNSVFFTFRFRLAFTPLKTRLPQPTVRAFLMTVLSLNYQQLEDSTGTNRSEIESVINTIIHNTSGIDYADIRPAAHIRYDLGID